MPIVQRLRARATLDDPVPVLERLAAAVADGDESWGRWLEEYQRGDALIVRVAVALDLDDGQVVEAANRGVLIENDAQPPKVEQQVAELVGKDFAALAKELSARGHEIGEGELHAMYVHVELADDVRRSLSRPAGRGAAKGELDHDVSLSEPEK